MAKPQKTGGKVTSTLIRAHTKLDLPRNECSEVRSTKTIAVLEPETRARRRTTGLRTAIGKQRSRLNAQTHGIFSRGRIVGDESAREFSLLLDGLIDDFKPEGALENLLVNQLATIFWRKRRILRAESAEIEKAIKYSAIDNSTKQAAEVWDSVRSGEANRGLLRDSDNPLMLREAVHMLVVVRCGLAEFGFKGDPWLLRKVYGVDHDGNAPFGTVFQTYLKYSKDVSDHAAGDSAAAFAEDRKNNMLMILDEEIKHLDKLWNESFARRVEADLYSEFAGLVPPLAVSERLLRYETHLSREFDRTLSQLERLQRMRLGQPVLPPIDVRLSK